jgi:Tol biopolymer transport system component
LAPDESWLAFVDDTQNWTVWRAALKNMRAVEPARFISSSGRNHTPRYSPDGSQVAFVSDRSGDWEVWICDQEGGHPRQLTHFGGPWLGGLNWSGDGKFLGFDARVNGHSKVLVMGADGSKPVPIETNEFEDRMPSWSRDGRYIYFNSDRSGTIALWKKPRAGGQAEAVSGVTAFQSMEASSGAALFFDAGGAGIWKSSLDGSDRTLPAQLAHVWPRLNWTVSSRGIYFADNSRDAERVWFYSFLGGEVTSIGKADKSLVMDTPSLSVSPDERWLLYAQQEHVGSDIVIRRGNIR